MDVAKQLLEKKDYKAALTNIVEGLKCSVTNDVKEKLLSILLSGDEN